MHDSVTEFISQGQVRALIETKLEHLLSAILGDEVCERCISRCTELLIDGQALLIDHQFEHVFQAFIPLCRLGKHCDGGEKASFLVRIDSYLHHSDCFVTLFL